MLFSLCVFSPLCLPGDEAERGVKKPAHLSQQPLLVNTEEEVRGRGVLEGHIHRLSRPTEQIQKYYIIMRGATGKYRHDSDAVFCKLIKSI